MTSVLRVQNATFVRGGRRILKGITWEVRPGQHWCILGPNGCGKTSLINLITGYEPATSGDIQIGEDQFGNSDWRDVRKRVGLVTNTLTTFIEPSEPVINVIASGREAKLNLWQDPPPAWQRQAATLLKATGSQHLRKSLWGTLSQGERQKVLICRALMAQFTVLILDEPCAGLDPVAREHFLTWMAEIATWPESPSLIMVTHHVEEILPCLTHVLLLKDGQVHSQGQKTDILTSESLSEIYGAPVELEERGDRYALVVG
ncbi:ATP-binding cassette domain-containing protein [Prosthecobacter sp. SYSU 5D2]|uniref:ABC transporter ATP-binding protein n=1 Tax=Prosthecobacter sp. SYSU 5D2 TaxID=3134134 RepID=UPI0031FF267E